MYLPNVIMNIKISYLYNKMLLKQGSIENYGATPQTTNLEVLEIYWYLVDAWILRRLYFPKIKINKFSVTMKTFEMVN